MIDSPPGPVLVADGLLVGTALALALWVRPWRAAPPEGPPAAWMLAWIALPLCWGVDRWLHMPLGVPLSGATLVVLMAGWPLAMLAMPFAAAALLLVQVPADIALHLLAWLGVVPGTLALGIGAALRRWLPHHPIVFILGRGYFGAFAAALAGHLAGLALAGAHDGQAGDSAIIARVLAAFSEAFLTGMVTAIGVAFRPRWLATWSDRVYLPPPPRA